jgi:hypothetical protein
MATTAADIIRMVRVGIGDMEKRVVAYDVPTDGKTDITSFVELALRDLNRIVHQAYAFSVDKASITSDLDAEEVDYLIYSATFKALNSDVYKKIREGVNVNTAAGHIDASRRPEWYLEALSVARAALKSTEDALKSRTSSRRPFATVDLSTVGQKEYFAQDNDTDSPYRDRS